MKCGSDVIIWKRQFYVNVIYWLKCILIIVQRDAKQSSLFIILQVRSTGLGCRPHQASLATLEGGSCTKNMTIPEVVVTVLCTPYDGCG